MYMVKKSVVTHKNFFRVLLFVFSFFLIFTQTGCGDAAPKLTARKAPIDWVKNDTKDGWLAYSPKGDMQMIYYKKQISGSDLDAEAKALTADLDDSCGVGSLEKKCGVTASSSFHIAGDEYRKVVFQDPSFGGETQMAVTIRSHELEIFELSGKDAQVKTPLIENIIQTP